MGTSDALKEFQNGVASWSMPSWDEGVTIQVGETVVRGRGLAMLAVPMAVMGVEAKRRACEVIEGAEASLRRSRIVMAWERERQEWLGEDSASSTGGEDPPTPAPSPLALLCVRGGQRTREGVDAVAIASGRCPPHPPYPWPFAPLSLPPFTTALATATATACSRTTSPSPASTPSSGPPRSLARALGLLPSRRPLHGALRGQARRAGAPALSSSLSLASRASTRSGAGWTGCLQTPWSRTTSR